MNVPKLLLSPSSGRCMNYLEMKLAPNTHPVISVIGTVFQNWKACMRAWKLSRWCTKNSGNLLATQCIAKCIWWNSYMQDIIRRCLVLNSRICQKKSFISSDACTPGAFKHRRKSMQSKIYVIANQTSVWTLKTRVIKCFSELKQSTFWRSYKALVRFHLYLCLKHDACS